MCMQNQSLSQYSRKELTMLYDDLVRRYSSNFVMVTVPYEKIEKIKSFINKIEAAKSKEKGYKKDGNYIFNRYYGGLLGEAAVEQLLGIDVIEWDVGKSDDYDHPDMHSAGYDIGIKTIKHANGRFPIIKKRNDYPQIICIYPDQTAHPGKVWVCGLATPTVLNLKQDIKLVTDPHIIQKGTKTGFYGFSDLIPVRSIDDIAPFKTITER